jgi:hypothetical protein
MSRQRVQTLPPASDDTVIPDPEHRHLLWARGYLYAREPSEPPHPWWRSHELGSRTLHFDPRLELSVARDGATFVAVLGIAVDLSEWLTDLGDIAEMLLDRRLRSRNAMIRALDTGCSSR